MTLSPLSRLSVAPLCPSVITGVEPPLPAFNTRENRRLPSVLLACFQPARSSLQILYAATPVGAPDLWALLIAQAGSKAHYNTALRGDRHRTTAITLDPRQAATSQALAEFAHLSNCGC